MDSILEYSQKQSVRAREVLSQSGVEDLWESAGAECRLVGSFRMGLLCKHRDIDLHIYSRGITTEMSFGIMAKLAQNPRITEIKCINGLHTDEHCIAWHVWYRADDDELWQIDMIHIESGTRYDGFFEKVADRIVARLTPETRRTILQLKYDTPDEEEIHGVEYYEAVLEHGVCTLNELRVWVGHHRKENAEYWMPD